MSRKILHLENKTTGEHKYYGSLVALCKDNLALPYHTLKRLKFEVPWENETFKIRLGSLLTPSDVEAGNNNGKRPAAKSSCLKYCSKYAL